MEGNRGRRGSLEGTRSKRSWVETQSTGTGRTVFTEELGERLIQRGPQGWCGALVALLSSPVKQGLCEVGKSLVQLSDLDQHGKEVHK